MKLCSSFDRAKLACKTPTYPSTSRPIHPYPRARVVSHVAVDLETPPTRTIPAPTASVSYLPPKADAPTFRIRVAQEEDDWAVAHCHCNAFYPRARHPVASALRVDRVMALVLGRDLERRRVGKFRTIVATMPLDDSCRSSSHQHTSSSSSSYSSASLSLPDVLPPMLSNLVEGVDHALQDVGARILTLAAGRKGDIRIGRVASVYRKDGRVSHDVPGGSIRGMSGLGRESDREALVGAVVLDSLAAHLPPQRVFGTRTLTRPRRGVAYLSNLCVENCARGLGLGKALVLETEKIAASWGYRTIALHCDVENEAALGLYKGMGYRPAQARPEWDTYLTERRQLILMVKRVPLAFRAQEANGTLEWID